MAPQKITGMTYQENRIQITVQGTPNPDAAKFLLDRPVPEGGSRSYFNALEAAGDPLAEAILQLEGVRAVLLVDNFVTVTKTSDSSWSELIEPVEAAIRSSLLTG